MANFTLNKNLEISKSNHTRLVKYIKDRLDYGNEVHKAYVDRLSAIDKEVAGYIRLDDDDKKRKRDTEQGYGPKPYDINIQLTKSQIDDAVTFLMEVFYPQEGPYSPIAPEDKQSIAKGLSVLMNKHADKFGHFCELERFCTNALKYNLGLIGCDWEQIRGAKVKGGITNAEVEQNAVLFEGNKLNCFDNYNTMFDPSVSPAKLHLEGEWFSTQEIVSNFRVQRLIEAGILFNLSEKDLDSKLKQNDFPYYQERPDTVGDAIQTDNYKTNWISYLSADLLNGKGKVQKMLEFETVRIWLPAWKFGMSKNENAYELWTVILANAKVVVFAEPNLTSNGMLPIFAGMPWNTEFERDEQSFAEILMPYQRFASFQMNIHQKAQRKALYGLTFFNDQILSGLNDSDMIAGKIPMSGGNMQNLSINDLVKQITDVPDTQNTLVDIDRMEQLMQKLLPTNKAQQVASLERATQYQAAAMVQASDRRNLKIAKIINTQALNSLRQLQVFNIKLFQQQIEMVDESGKSVEIDIAQIRQIDFEFMISAALRGIDKLLIVEFMKDILFAILQSPRAAQEIDTTALMDYITSVMGEFTDLRQFKFENEFDKLTPEQKQMAFSLLQQAMMQQANQQGGGGQQNQ